MTKKSALIISGGWDGHHPLENGKAFTESLEQLGLTVRHETSLEVLEDRSTLETFDLIVPNWTMGSLNENQLKNLCETVHSGTGLGGFHGGMGDAFRGATNYEWMVGGHFVGHPHVGEYAIRRTSNTHTITESFPDELDYKSEQYYMLIDPVIEVLIDSTYHYAGKSCTMPVVWTKQWGSGRVFYSALGHEPEEFNQFPEVKEMTLRGLQWAAGAF